MHLFTSDPESHRSFTSRTRSWSSGVSSGTRARWETWQGQSGKVNTIHLSSFNTCQVGHLARCQSGKVNTIHLSSFNTHDCPRHGKRGAWMWEAKSTIAEVMGSVSISRRLIDVVDHHGSLPPTPDP
jgi:hypothetical protein